MVHVALALFVLVWILGPSELRDAVPILPVFLVALGLELSFLVSALRERERRPPDRRPQEIDRQRYGFEQDELEDEADEARSSRSRARLRHHCAVSSSAWA